MEPSPTAPIPTQAAEAFLLAGGAGRRLGEDKRFLLFQGKPLYAFQLEKLRAVFGRVTLLCKSGERGRFDLWDGAAAEEEAPGSALLHGLISGLEHLSAPAGFFLGVDLPLFPIQGLEFFRGLSPAERVVVPRAGGRVQFACALYPRSILPLLHQYRDRGEYRLMTLLAALPHQSLEEDQLPFLRSEPRAFFNLNTPADLEALRRIDHPTAGGGAE